jgi:hypothetical protein
MSPDWLAPSLMAALLAVVLVGDHPRPLADYRVQTVHLDAAYTDEAALVRRLEHILGARVHRVAVRRVDLVNDTTNVDVRYQLLDQDTAPHPRLRHDLLPDDEGGP